MSQGFLKNGPESAAWALLRIMLEMQILKPHPWPTESKILGVGCSVCSLTRSPGNSDTLQAQVWEPLS